MTSVQREQLLALGADLERAWEHPSASVETAKRILRAVLKEIVVRATEERLELKLHWQGGDHSELSVAKNRHGLHRWTTPAETEQLIAGLARLLPDRAIAALLNRWGRRTAKGCTWTSGACVRIPRGSPDRGLSRRRARAARRDHAGTSRQDTW
jgi:hypothetical protein